MQIVLPYFTVDLLWIGCICVLVVTAAICYGFQNTNKAKIGVRSYLYLVVML